MDNYRDTGIDIIKAISIVLVLIWHIKPVVPALSMMQVDISSPIYKYDLIIAFYRYITLLAVPSFICISLYLFIRKIFLNTNYWKKRLVRLIQLFLFWAGIQFIFYLLSGGKLPLPVNTIIPSGGPELPYVGGSVFYFLFVLIVCTTLTTLFLKLTETVKLIVSVSLIALSCLHFAFSPVYKFPIDTQAMENYYLYIPIAYYMTTHQEKFIRCRTIFIFGYLLAIFYEQFVLNSVVSAYGRLSIFMGVLSFISIFLGGRFTPYRPVVFLAKFSLGIFALHKYWQYIFIMLLGVIKITGSISFLSATAERLLLFIVTTIFTFISVYLLSKTKIRNYIS